MNIPETVKIGWRNYLVAACTNRKDALEEVVAGEIDYDNHIIYLDETIVQPHQKQLTLLHEIIHGIFQYQGHTEWRKNEELIEAISEGLMQVILDNPKLFTEEETV